MSDTATSDLLTRRLAHYRHNYSGDRLRQRLIDDGFPAYDVDRLLAESVKGGATDLYGIAAPEPSAPSLFVTLPTMLLTAVCISLVTGYAPWIPLLAGRTILIQLPFAILSALVGVDVVLFVKTRYDWPNVSRGVAVGIFGGVIVFFSMFFYVFQHVTIR